MYIEYTDGMKTMPSQNDPLVLSQAMWINGLIVALNARKTLNKFNEIAKKKNRLYNYYCLNCELY